MIAQEGELQHLNVETVTQYCSVQKQRYSYRSCSRHVMGLPCIPCRSPRAEDERGNGVLLLFPQGGSLQQVETPGGFILPHDRSGSMHVTFSLVADELEAWRDNLQTAGLHCRAGDVS